jgi:hypothetical protein
MKRILLILKAFVKDFVDRSYKLIYCLNENRLFHQSLRLPRAMRSLFLRGQTQFLIL